MFTEISNDTKSLIGKYSAITGMLGMAYIISMLFVSEPIHVPEKYLIINPDTGEYSYKYRDSLQLPEFINILMILLVPSTLAFAGGLIIYIEYSF